MTTRIRPKPWLRGIAAAIVLSLLPLSVVTPAQAVGSYDNALIADEALSRVGQNGGQCRAFVNAIIDQVSGGSQQPYTAGNKSYFQTFIDEDGVRITNSADLRKGDVVQKEEWDSSPGLHTWIIVSHINGNTWNVVDSNHDSDGKVQNYNRTFTLSEMTRAYRMGTVLVQPSAPASNVTTFAGNWAGPTTGTVQQDFMYVTPRSDGGTDFAVFRSDPGGIQWAGSWASASNISFMDAQFIPNDLNGDGLLDMLYVTPRSGGGFDMGYLRNTGSQFIWTANLWSPPNLNMNSIKFMPGNFVGNDTLGDLAYVTPNSNGGFDIAVLQSNGTQLTYTQLWWHETNLSYSNTRFVPVDMNSDGRLDLLYTTPRPGTNGFDMSIASNTGSVFSWVGFEWGEPNINYSDIKFIPGYFGSSTQQGFAYVVKLSGGGFDVRVMNVLSNGHLQMGGTWWTAANLAYASTVFVPQDNNADGRTDMLYATPRSGGGFDMALVQNTGTVFSFVGQQWNPNDLTLGSTKFLPQF
ncbi:MAG TPA: hypothetical protein VD735_01365 [Candidatus Saccharimonadales bacterium]|nr:hypothetical protein [Candidatus Saccharimonadales bacterium]